MIFELQHAALPAGYGDDLLSLAECKQQLSIEVSNTDDDTLIPLLRDAAIEFVEGRCEVRLGPVTDLVWKAEMFPADASTAIELGVRPVTAVTAIEWFDAAGAAVAGAYDDYRLLPHGRLLPVVGGEWPSDVGGGIEITFDAGFAADEAPNDLLAAVRLFLGHLYLNREAVVIGQVVAEAPLAVTVLCDRWRRMYM